MKLYRYCSDPASNRYCTLAFEGFFGSLQIATSSPALAIMKDHGNLPLRFPLDEARGGLALPDVVPDASDRLVLRRSCLDAIASSHNLGHYEAIPMLLINSKGRIHSDEYVIVNVIGEADCLDFERSEMCNAGRFPAVRIFGKFWITRSRIPEDLHIFRAKGVCTGYMFTERLVDFIRQQGFTNFAFRDVQLS
ncbi:MAG: double-CXXCG motif protein [Myxococcota bacterium]